MLDNTIMSLEAQKLRTRVLHLEYAINRFFHDGDIDRLHHAYSNEWVRPMRETNE
jgi:hypothetical protein